MAGCLAPVGVVCSSLSKTNQPNSSWTFDDARETLESLSAAPPPLADAMWTLIRTAPILSPMSQLRLEYLM
ncbi:hypothetical protein DPMN_123383 [Dreissena polymorpha]|uniref:Uncharacterized protein n=1 Tax=Dreissena polymorpha TaxID=45954 RepID=A0A9D4GRG9_DREPO|nr:hypothetical protein DPMN_123383 [Dreissena polymorpha]